MEENLKPKKKKRKFFDSIAGVILSAILIFFAGSILGVGLFGLLGKAGDALSPGFSSSDVWVTLYLYLPFIGIWLATLLFLAISPSNRPIFKALWTNTKGNSVKMLLVGLAIGLGMNLFCAAVAMLNGDIALYFDSFKPVSFLFIFVFVFIQSSAEELICRAYIFQKLVKGYGKPILASVVNSVFFMFLHILNNGVTVLSLINIMLYGLLFSAIVIYMDSLWCAMAVHAAWNFCQNILLGLPNSGSVLPYSVFKLDAASAQNSFAYSVGFGLEGTITACAVLLAAAALIVWYGKKKGIHYTKIWENGAAEA